MRLVADSGSSKTSWYLLPKTGAKPIQQYKTEGYNPYFVTTAQIQKSLQEQLPAKLDKAAIEAVFFYGAGCSNAENQEIMAAALRNQFPKATIQVQSDLIAAARATAGVDAGICCILGTGTNSCVYNGNFIVEKVPSLGFVLADEGSGKSIGQALLRAYFYGKFPAELKTVFETSYELDLHKVVQRVIQGPMPNRYLASFTQFAVTHLEQDFIQDLVKTCMDEFVKEQLLVYQKWQTLPVHVVGSVGYGFRQIFHQSLQAHGFTVGKAYKEPFPALLDFHAD